MRYTKENPQITIGERRYCLWQENNVPTSTTYARWLWEKEHGEIPKGYIIHHKDGESLNDVIDNYELVNYSQHRNLHNELNNKPPEYNEQCKFLEQHTYMDTCNKDILNIPSGGNRNLTVEKVAIILGLSVRNIKGMMQQGQLCYRNIGGVIRVKESDLEAYIERKSSDTTQTD